MKVFHYLVKDVSLGVVRDLYDPEDGFNARNWSVAKSSYGLSLPRTTWFGTERAGGDPITVAELRSGDWAKTSGFLTDTGQVIGDRYLDTSGTIDIVSFNTNTTLPVEVTIYASEDGSSPEFYEDEWERFGPFFPSDEFDIQDAGRYVVFDFDFGANPAPSDFEAYIRIEISKPIMAPLYASTRQAVDNYPEWMSIRELPAIDSDVVVSPPSDNLGASVINALSGEWVEDIQRKIPYSEFQRFISTADDAVLAWGYRVEGMPEYVHSIKGDGVELARTSDLQELKEAYSVYIHDDDEVEQVIDDACWIDFNDQAIYTVKHYDSLLINGEVELAANQEPFHFWNHFDELGLFVSLDRIYLEDNNSFRERILDVYQNRGSVGIEGFKNVLRRELGMLDEAYADIEILTMGEIERDPKYFAPDGLPAQDENGAYPFVELVRSISTLFPSTWGNFRWDDALWDVAGKDYAGYGVVPYRYDAELAPERYLQSGVGDGDDLLVHHPDTITGPQEFEWTLKARTRRKILTPEYPRVDFECTVTPYGEIDVYDNPINTLWLTAEVVTTGSDSYYLPFEISAKSDVDYYTLSPTRSSWGSASIFSDEGNKTLPGFRDVNGVLYGETPAPSASITMGAVSDADLDFSTDNLSFEISVDYSEFLPYSFSGAYATTQELVDALNAEVLGVTFSIDADHLVVTSDSQSAISRVYVRNVLNPKTSGLETGVDVANSGVDEEEIEASIPAEEIATVRLHNGRLEYGVLRAQNTDDTFKVWFSHEDNNFLESSNVDPIEYTFSGQYARVLMESNLTSFTTQEWTYDSFSYDVSVNGKAPYTEPSPTTVKIPEIIWRDDAVNRGYKIQLLTTNITTNFQGEEVVEYGVFTQTEQGESWFIPSDVLLVNGSDQQWSNAGLATTDDSIDEITFATTQVGLFPSPDLYPDEELYPISQVSYPVPNHVWEYEEHYLLTAADALTGDRGIAYFNGIVDENGPWRYGRPQRPDNMNPLLSTIEALRRYDFDIPESRDVELVWVAPELKSADSRVILWLDSHVVSSDEHYFSDLAPDNAIREQLSEDSQYHVLDPFRVYGRLKPIDSEWYPKITSGHFYDRGEEYYFYASQRTETTTDSEILLQDVARQGAPLAVTTDKVGSALILSGGAHAVFKDVNLLLPAEAHLDNHTNQWYGRRHVSVSANDTITPLFGSSVLFAAATELVVPDDRFTIGLMRHVPVESGEEHTFSFSIRPVQDKSFRVRTRMVWSDATVSYSAQVSYAEVRPEDGWVRFTHTATAHIGATSTELAIDIFALEGETLEEGDAVYLDELMFAQGTETEFVPSTRIQGDIDIRALAYLDERSDTYQTTILDKGSAYRFYVTPTGYLKLEYSTAEETFVSQSTMQIPQEAGGIWVRAQLRMDVGGFRNQIRFFTSQDGQLWSTLGSPVSRTQTELTVLDPTPDTLTLGAKNDGSTSLNGAIVKAEVRDGIGGNVVAYADWSSEGPWDISSTSPRLNSVNQLWSLENEAYVYWHRHSPFADAGSSLVELRQTSFTDPESDTVQLSSKDHGYFQVSTDHSVYLPYGDVYDVTVKHEELVLSADEFSSTNRIEIYDAAVETGDMVWVEYTPRYSYYVDNSVVDLNAGRQRSLVVFDRDSNLAGVTEYEIVYEGSYYDPAAYVDLALNPLYTSQSEGFLFISHNEYPLTQVKLSISPSTLVADGEDYAMVTINTLDNMGNPKPYRSIALSTTFGEFDHTEVITDQDGFATVLLFSTHDESVEYGTEATIVADGGFVSETTFYVNPPQVESSTLVAVPSSKRVPANGESYNLVHGRLQSSDHQPIADHQLHWRKKRSIKELFTEDREGLRLSLSLNLKSSTRMFVTTSNLLDAPTSNLHYTTGEWTAVSDWTSFSVSEAHARFGRTSLKATRHDNVGSIILSAGKYDVEPDQQYALSCEVRPNKSARVVRPEIRWFDESDTLISYDDAEAQELLGNWERVHVTAQSPANAVRAEVLVRWIGCQAEEVHFLDAVNLTAGDGTGYVPSWTGLKAMELVVDCVPSSFREMGIVAFYDSKSAQYTAQLYLDENNLLRIAARDTNGDWVESSPNMDVHISPNERRAIAVSRSEESDLYEVHFADPESGSWKRLGVLPATSEPLRGDQFFVGTFDSGEISDFYGSIFYTSLRDRKSNGSFLFEGDFTESGPWSANMESFEVLEDAYGCLWELHDQAEVFEYRSEDDSIDLTEEIDYILSLHHGAHFVEGGTKWLPYPGGCGPAPGEIGSPGGGFGYQVIIADDLQEYNYTAEFEGSESEPRMCSNPPNPGNYEDEVFAYQMNDGSILVIDNDSSGTVVTDDNGRFTIGPFFAEDVPGYWFCSIESYDLVVGDVVSWFEHPVIAYGVENPDDVPDSPLQDSYSTSAQPYANEVKYTASSYHDDATIEEKSDVDIVWLPPTWYAITAYDQLQLGIDGHDVAKSV